MKEQKETVIKEEKLERKLPPQYNISLQDLQNIHVMLNTINFKGYEEANVLLTLKRKIEANMDFISGKEVK